MLRRSSRAGKRDRENAKRNAGHLWPELDPDLIVELAKNCDAQSLSRFSCVCRAWHDATSNASNLLWAPLLEDHYPRALLALKLLPEATLNYKAIYRDQMEGEVARPSIKPPPTCKLSDFVFTIELIKDTADVKEPARAKLAKEFFKESAEERLRAAHPDDWEKTVNEEWEKLGFPARQVYYEQTAADVKRYKTEYEQYEHDQNLAWRTAPVVRSWTGGLQDLPRGNFGEASFKVPLRWQDWQQSWPGESPASMWPSRMRLRVLASRVVNNKLCTRLLVTSQEKPDDGDGGVVYMWGRRLLYTDEPFNRDEYRITPELQLAFEMAPPHHWWDPWEPRPWKHDELTLCFELYVPDDRSDPMTAEQLLRYLEYCVPWSMGS